MRNSLVCLVLLLAACSGARPESATVQAFDPTQPFEIVGYGNRCLDAANAGSANGTPLQIWDCWQGANQLWTYRDGALHVSTGRCLDIPNGDTTNGTRAQLWDCNGSPAQQLTYTDAHELRGPGGKCLDVYNFGNSDGAVVDLWDCNGGDNQKWYGVQQAPPPAMTYPPGDPGSDQLLVRATSEQPAASDIGAFRVICNYSHMSMDDPIVFPGQPGAAHLHMFFGNSGTDAYSTYDSLRTTGQSTCWGGIANKSAYWAPALLDGNDDPLVPTFNMVYYKAGYDIAGVSPHVAHLPAGLRMIAGDSHATAPQETERAYWGCHEVFAGHNRQIVDCGVGNSIQLEVVFPQCWNGVDLDSPDHKSHMAYPVDGACPADHPVAIPQITLNVAWRQDASTNVAALRLSSDHYDTSSLPGGYSVHADYMEAWEPSIRDTFVDHCINPTVDCHGYLLGDGRELYYDK